MQKLFAIIWASTVIDVILGGLAVAWLHATWQQTGSRAANWRRLVVYGLLLFWFARLFLLISMRLEMFGLIRVIYLELVIVFPALGLTWLLVDRLRADPAGRRSSALARGIALCACLLAPVGIFTSFIEPFRLQLETATVPVAADRAGEATIRVGVLSDIQTVDPGDYERQAVARVMAEKPDIILLPGDLWQGRPRPFQEALPALRALLGGLEAPGGVYFVLGNVDRRAEIERLVAGTSVTLLVNETRQVTVRDRRITIGGTELDETTPAAQRLIRQLELEPGIEDLRILLSHRPDPVLYMQPGSRIDLVVSGHTHGGQIQLPLFGPLLTLSGVPRAVAAGGLHDLGDGRRVYVSRGVGHEHGQAPRIRFLCPPEISLLTLADQ